MNEHLFLGDTTYPHTPAFNLVETLRNFGDQGEIFDESVVMRKAADRIEQLERELAEAQKDADRYRWLQDWLEGKTQSTKVFLSAKTRSEYDQAIDAAINGVKA